MAALHPALAYLYTYDGMTGQLSSERVRVPGGYRTKDSSPFSVDPASSAKTQSATVRTLDKDMPLLAEVIPVGDGDAVYFAERGEARRPASPASSDTDDESEDEDAPARRPRAVQQALQTVLDVELLARLLEEQLSCVEDLEDDAGSEQVVPEEGNDDDHWKEYKCLTATYKALTEKAKQLYSEVFATDWENATLWTVENVNSALATAGECLATLDEEIYSRREHHRRFFSQPDDRHASHEEWIRGLRKKHSEVAAIVNQLRTCKAKLLDEERQRAEVGSGPMRTLQ
ncbi:hypothetical protein ACG7TL_008906 [Trametes sanguinea]